MSKSLTALWNISHDILQMQRFAEKQEIKAHDRSEIIVLRASYQTARWKKLTVAAELIVCTKRGNWMMKDLFFERWHRLWLKVFTQKCRNVTKGLAMQRS